MYIHITNGIYKYYAIYSTIAFIEECLSNIICSIYIDYGALISIHICVGVVSIKEEDPNRNRKKPLGETNHFCPIALNKSNILFPGNPEIAVKYKDKVYYFSTNEARDEFLESPETFLPTDKPFQVQYQCFVIFHGL